MGESLILCESEGHSCIYKYKAHANFEEGNPACFTHLYYQFGPWRQLSWLPGGEKDTN